MFIRLRVIFKSKPEIFNFRLDLYHTELEPDSIRNVYTGHETMYMIRYRYANLCYNLLVNIPLMFSHVMYRRSVLVLRQKVMELAHVETSVFVVNCLDDSYSPTIRCMITGYSMTMAEIRETHARPIRLGNTWWRHQMETFSALLAFGSPNECPAQRPATRSFDVFFDLCLNNGWVNNC